MFLSEVSAAISSTYQSIPGQTKGDKASFVAARTFETFACIGIGYGIEKLGTATIRAGVDIDGLISANHQSFFKSFYPLFLLNGLPDPLNKIGGGIAIVHQMIDFRQNYSKLSQTTKWSDRLYFALLTYSTISFAYDFFKKIVPSDSPKQDAKKVHPTPFEVGTALMSFALQLNYAPKYTLAGALTGVLLRENRAMLLMTLDHESPLRRLIKDNAIFSNPVTTAQKCYHTWLAWGLVSRSVTDDLAAFQGGFDKGQTIAACFRSYFP